RWAGVHVFKPLRVVKGTPRDTLFVRFEQNIRDASTNLLNAIPPARRADVIARANGPLSPKLYVDMNNPGSWFPSKPKYMPFWDHVILTPRCALVIPNDAAPSIPHEVGHYLHHLLLDSGYGVFATRPLSSSHAIGSPGCRQNLIEEPAYLAEYYLKGSVGGRNPEGGGFAGSGPSGPNDPATVDFTDIEGFGMAVFASLIRDDPTILNYEGKRVAVPVVGGQRDSLFQACYEIIALGTNDIPTLLDRVRAVLAAVGKEAKLPAMLQPLGLTYRARARIVDGAGDPIEGVTARAVSKVGTTEYLLPVCDAPTGEDGACTFRTIFPGSCTLRIYDGGDSTDVGTGVSVPWGTPTTQWIDLGDVAFVPDRLLEALHRRTNVSIGFGGMMDFENGDSQYTLEEYFTGSNVQSGGAPIAWEGAAFSYSASGSYEDLCEGTISWSISISGAADLDERTMDGSLQYEAKNARESHVDSWSLQITGLPLSASSVPPYTVLRFSASGPGAAAYIGGVEAYISHLCSGYQPGNYTGTDWGNEVRPWVSIDFGEPDGGTNR
ncbi:MAG: carboxypeptidase-like regulatory domain-containing protein, partial [Candidatus Eisenbacteria bacterium]|nr:carboxypeptidase-like regulatory domain-containing protein [Candidatus Eisenbacteria bacterium]